MTRGFGSDNHSGVHPKIWQALGEANQGHAPSYGTDKWCERALKIFRQHFGPETEVFYVFNGTAANALALKAMTQSFHSVLCADISHLNVDECGAPEFFTGGKLVPLSTKNGKLQLDDLKKTMIRGGDQHFSQPKVLSLTQPTELGTVYTQQELNDLCNWAHASGLYVHMDGARLANAATHLKLDLAEITSEVGIDVLSLGGTKNGFLFGEALVFFNSSLAKDFKYIRKQAGQLPSKSRFIAAGFESYLKNDLWQEISQHECSMAERLCQQLKTIGGVEITQPRQSNAVFVKMPKPLIKQLRDAGYFFYVWNESTFECRLMTSWDTTTNDIDGFVQKLRSFL